MNFHEVTIADKAVFDKCHTHSDASESVFTTMFIWKDYYRQEFCEDGGTLFIRFNIKGNPAEYFFPMGGDVRSAMEKLFEISHERGEKLHLRFITEAQKEEIEALFPDKFEFIERREWEDYVYESEKLISLSGKKLHSKRNHINRFVAEHPDFEYESVTAENIDECAGVSYRLTNEKEHDNSFEIMAMHKFFENYGALNQKGAILRVHGEIVALTFGEAIDESHALIQIEQASNDYNGAYTVMNQMFAEREWSDFKYINREEDMGIEGLRKAKESYHPAYLVKKYRATEK